MVWIRVLPTGIGRVINLPESVAHRSVEGDALPLAVGHSREVTEDEWNYIQEAHADLVPGIERLPDNVVDTVDQA